MAESIEVLPSVVVDRVKIQLSAEGAFPMASLFNHQCDQVTSQSGTLHCR